MPEALKRVSTSVLMAGRSVPSISTYQSPAPGFGLSGSVKFFDSSRSHHAERRAAALAAAYGRAADNAARIAEARHVLL